MGDWLYLIIGIAVVAIGLLGRSGDERAPAQGGRSRRRRRAVPTSSRRPARTPTSRSPTTCWSRSRPRRPSRSPRRRRPGWCGCAQRLAGSQGGFGRGLLALLSRDRLDEDTWEAIEDTLLTADVGVAPTQELVEGLRTRLRVDGDRGRRPEGGAARGAVKLVGPDMDRRLQITGADGNPASCSSSASTAPARPPPSASSPGSWSPRTRRSCSARPTPSAPPPSSSWRPGASGSASRSSAAPRAATPRAWPSTRSRRAPTEASTRSSSTPPAASRTRPA